MVNNERNLKRVIYTSSPDRGLEHLLKIWPDVAKEVSDAELHVCYGFQLFDKFHADNPGAMQWKEKLLEQMSDKSITNHDRLPQPELAELLKTCGIWAYSQHFGEINCISALKAQAYGAVPITMDYAAVHETCQFGIKIKGDIYDDKVKNTYKKQFIWLLQNPDWQEKVRKPMMEWAESHFAWSRVAQQWNAEFLGKPYEQVLVKPKEQLVKIIDGYSGQEITDKELSLRNDKKLQEKDSIAL